MSTRTIRTPPQLLSGELLRRSVIASFTKLNPLHQLRNPVMFAVLVGSFLASVSFIAALVSESELPAWFIGAVAVLLWCTLLFSNFAEAVAEGRGKAQAESLRVARRSLMAHRVDSMDGPVTTHDVSSGLLRAGDVVRVLAGETIPGDGEVTEGAAYVDESAVTGESAPVIRESGGDRSSVTGGTRVLSDWLIIRITANPGESFLDRMIGLVEGAKRQKTPNEIALSILLAALTITFLVVCATLLPFSMHSASASGGGGKAVPLVVLIALFVCLAPTTIGGLLSAIGIAGMDRLLKANVVATSGRAVEAAGDVDVLLMDKTGTITLGSRQATELIPAPGVDVKDLAKAAQLSSLTDETPEGRSVVILAKTEHGLRQSSIGEMNARFVPFTAESRMSGVDTADRRIRKGAAEAVGAWVHEQGGELPAPVRLTVEAVAKEGCTPLVVAEDATVLGVVRLKDVLKEGIRERFAELRRMGIRTIMITGDNALTAAAIAAEAGVDDFLAEATPEKKLALIREYQAGGRLVAMTGDGTNDAPALAQADVAVAMNSGTQAAKEAGNMVDLDSNPTKLIEIVRIGKQLLMTRGALTTFSITNDVAKYFAIIPAAFAATYPQLNALNVMGLASPRSAILSATIFNALIIVALIPLALKGVKYRAVEAGVLLRDNILIYGLGGLVTPFIGIKLIDLLISALGLA